MATILMSASARIVTEYIPGTGCGTVNTIRMLDRDPSAVEVANGCVYVRRAVSAFQPEPSML